MAVIQDIEFDSLCTFLLMNYDEIAKGTHPHKKLVTRENLKAGTFLYSGKLPVRMVAAARSWAEENGLDTGDSLWQLRMVGL